jgi:16S rRNA (adenine1518-N6/adenine1519-N6)-dimethyltransferase
MDSPQLPAPRKRFGQHFLHDPGVIRRIVDASSGPGDPLLVEIGPGRGAITRPLLERHGSLIAIEFDRDLAAHLRATLTPLGLTVIEQDVLAVDWPKLAAGRSLRVVGNLPYNIATPIIFGLLAHVPIVSELLFMVQREVAERLAAEPGSRAYGRLSVMVQVQCEVECLFHIGPGAFTPPPKVDSSIVRLQPQSQPLATDRLERLGALVALAFQSRRKTLRNALRDRLLPEQMLAAAIDPGCRPETLSVHDFLRLSELAEPGGVLSRD